MSSENSKNDLAKKFNVPLNNITVVYEGIAQEVFKPIDDEVKKNIIKNKFSIKTPYILFVSAIDWKKNIINMFKAFKIASESFEIPHQLVLAGSYFKSSLQPSMQFILFNEILKELTIYDKVIFSGYISDEELVFLYNFAHTYILPSFYEGFPLTALEAMACGTTVISSNTSSMPEILKEVCLYFNPMDIDSMAKAMIQACNDSISEKYRIGEGFKLVKNYTWENSARNVMNIFSKLRT